MCVPTEEQTSSSPHFVCPITFTNAPLSHRGPEFLPQTHMYRNVHTNRERCTQLQVHRNTPTHTCKHSLYQYMYGSLDAGIDVKLLTATEIIQSAHCIDAITFFI